MIIINIFYLSVYIYKLYYKLYTLLKLISKMSMSEKTFQIDRQYITVF